MPITLRELKYVILGDDRLSSKLQGITKASDKATMALRSHSTQLTSLRSNFTNFSQEIPGVGTALRYLSNPLVMVGAGFAGIGYGISKAVEKAAEFNSNFRNLANINLDKTDAQLNNIRQSILDLSYMKGFDPNQVNQAFIDVQNVTGKTGSELESIITQVGEFSHVFNTDFNATIMGSSKAMKMFNFDQSQLSKYLSSTRAAALAAKIPFDRLIETQTYFAGAAQGSNLGFDAANKVFALVGQEGNPMRAALRTQMVLHELYSKSSIKAFKSVGMDLFDKKGAGKQVDEIIIELNKKFMTAFAKGGVRMMNTLRDQFSGAQALAPLLDAAADRSGAVLKTLHQISGAMLDFKRATELADQDLNVINEHLNNRLKVSVINLGTEFLPIWIKAKQTANFLLNAFSITNAMMGGNLQKASMVAMTMSGYEPPQEITRTTDQYQSLYLEAWKKFSDTSLPLNMRKRAGQQKDYYFGKLQQNTPGGAGGKGGAGDDKITNGLEGISGGGVKNVTVNIAKMIETFSINTTSVKESTGDIKRVIEETMVRAVAGAEQTISH